MRPSTPSHLAALAVGLVLSASVYAGDTSSPSPLLSVLDQFTAPDVPAHGPGEVPQDRSWPAPTAPAPAWPGQGLAQHPMLYAGEGYNTLFLVNGGKVIWTYSAGRFSPERGGEIDDVWLMSNGHILFARQFSVQEITPQKTIVWHYEPPAGTEVHTAQPIGLDKVLLVQNGLPPKLMLINKKTGEVEIEHALPATSFTNQKTVHPQFRRIRMTAAGTFLVPFLKMGQVVEYNRDMKEVWRYEIPTPWAAVRLHNGNTLITDEHDKLVREVNPKGETVWEFTPADLPPGLVFHNTQTADRLANGDTVIFSSTGGSKKEDRPNIIQAIEVSPDKKIVWVLQDWKDLGPATTAQFLDEPGIPEQPGDLQH
jgi:outer membrane protein assembly factor BamB